MNQNEQYYYVERKGFTTEAKAYLTPLRPYLLVIITLFLLATAAGYVSAYFNPDILLCSCLQRQRDMYQRTLTLISLTN